MLHAARQLPSWLIFDVGQNLGASSAMLLLSNLGFRHSLVSPAGRTGCHPSAGKHDGYYRNPDSFRLSRWRALRQIFQPVARMDQGRFAAFGSARLMAAASPGLERVLSPSAIVFGAEPNKALEPTTFAVTSRAMVRPFEMKQQNPNCDAARAAPAKVVAHL
jgi:hypothetical protein